MEQLISKNLLKFKNFKKFRDGIERFRKIAIFLYGNVKFAFKTLSKNSNELALWLKTLHPISTKEYRMRRQPVLPIEEIPPDETYYLGYVIEKELEEKIKHNPTDQIIRQEEEKRKEIVQRGENNHKAYLASDHLDVYVATSMRERHEYRYVNSIIKDIFNSRVLAPLKLRVFDPTQAYCKDRVDKGLSEALMLRRARCTIYLAQESDTFGKDSELASTLAQGKPVIAFVPKADDKFCDKLIDELKDLNPDISEVEIILKQLKAFNSSLAWENFEVQSWLKSPEEADLNAVKELFYKIVGQHYDKRAKMLCEIHPLGIQVHIETGVANGVLVARTTQDCARLISRIITNTMEFRLEVKREAEGEYLHLIEEITGCIFRVVTGDAMLTNTFWNYYISGF